MSSNIIDIIQTVTGTHFVHIDVKNRTERDITHSEAEMWYFNKGSARWSDKAVTFMEEVVLDPDCMQI
jgi:mannose-6-phosphate isomerase-like protein (cupin superfamily)